MRILIAGAGTVGTQLAGRLCDDNHDVIVVDSHSYRLRKLEEYYDLQVLYGDASSVDILKKVNVEAMDLVIAVTDSDTSNVMIGHLADKMGAKFKIARVRNSGCFDDASILTPFEMGLDKVIFPETMAAREIHHLVTRPFAINAWHFLKDKVEVVELEIEPGSMLDGQVVRGIRCMSEYNFLLACVVRKNAKGVVNAFVPVNRKDEIQGGDHIYVVAHKDEIKKVVCNLGFDVKPVEKVFVYGGTNIGMEVARTLETSQVQVVMVEPHRPRTKEMAFELNKALVLHGEGTDANLLEGEGVAEAEIFIAVTKDENSNLLSCLLAKKLGVKKAISMVTKPDYVPLISELNIDSVISQRLMTINQIMRFVRRGAIVSFEELVEEQINALEFRVTDKTLVLGETLSSKIFRSEFPDEVLIGGVIRGEEVLVPQGDTVLQEYDRVLVFCPHDLVAELEQFFA
jgi:trk system potassium uptake protein TrkA